jgi:SAM-dependent methyltransferase
MLETARSNASSARAGQASFQQLDVATADLTGLEPADVVLCVGVLAHMPAPEVVVAKAASLVKPGGRLVLQITDYGRPVGKCFYWMARLASPRRSYRLARMASDQVIRWAGSSGLNLTTTRCYPTSLPGYRRLPIRVQERMLEAMRASAWAAPLRTETLLLFDKPALPSA